MGFEDFGLVIAVTMVLMGGTFAVIGARVFGHWVASLRRRRITCWGIVTDTRVRSSNSNSDGGGTFLEYPVLAFRTEDGREVQAEAANSSSFTTYEPGQRVKITYDAANPLTVHTGRTGAAWAVPFVAALFLLVGLGILAIGGINLVASGALTRLLEVLS